jgi:hypothetical protein
MKFYGGIQSLISSYEVFYPSAPHLSRISPWQLVAGTQLSSRWAVQVGYTYSHDVHDHNPSYTGTTVSGEPMSGSLYNELWEQAIPLGFRYCLLRWPKPRLQIDVIAGTTVVTSRFQFDEVNKISSRVTHEFHSSGHATQLYATLGLGARYPFGRHFEGVFDYSYSRNLRSVPEGLHLAVSGNEWGLTRAYSLGLRYRFNLKKKAATPGGA